MMLKDGTVTTQDTDVTILNASALTTGANDAKAIVIREGQDLSKVFKLTTTANLTTPAVIEVGCVGSLPTSGFFAANSTMANLSADNSSGASLATFNGSLATPGASGYATVTCTFFPGITSGTPNDGTAFTASTLQTNSTPTSLANGDTITFQVYVLKGTSPVEVASTGNIKVSILSGVMMKNGSVTSGDLDVTTSGSLNTTTLDSKTAVITPGTDLSKVFKLTTTANLTTPAVIEVGCVGSLPTSGFFAANSTMANLSADNSSGASLATFNGSLATPGASGYATVTCTFFPGITSGPPNDGTAFTASTLQTNSTPTSLANGDTIKFQVYIANEVNSLNGGNIKVIAPSGTVKSGGVVGSTDLSVAGVPATDGSTDSKVLLLTAGDRLDQIEFVHTANLTGANLSITCGGVFPSSGSFSGTITVGNLSGTGTQANPQRLGTFAVTDVLGTPGAAGYANVLCIFSGGSFSAGGLLSSTGTPLGVADLIKFQIYVTSTPASTVNAANTSISVVANGVDKDGQALTNANIINGSDTATNKVQIRSGQLISSVIEIRHSANNSTVPGGGVSIDCIGDSVITASTIDEHVVNLDKNFSGTAGKLVDLGSATMPVVSTDTDVLVTCTFYETPGKGFSPGKIIRDGTATVPTGMLLPGNSFTFRVTAKPAFGVTGKVGTATVGTTSGSPTTFNRGQGEITVTLYAAGDLIPGNGSLTCTEVGTNYLTITSGTVTYTAAAGTTETTSTVVGSFKINSDVPVSHTVRVTCTGDGTVFGTNAANFYFALTYYEDFATLPDFMVDEPVLETLFNASADNVVTSDTQKVKATCTPHSDQNLTSAVQDIFTTTAGVNQDDFILEFTSDGSVTTGPTAQFGITSESVAFDTPGTYWLKCLQTGSTSAVIAPEKYFVRKAVVKGDRDVLQLKPTSATDTRVIRNQADLATATATEFKLNESVSFNLASSVAFTPTTGGIVGLSCEVNKSFTAPTTFATTQSVIETTFTNTTTGTNSTGSTSAITFTEATGMSAISAGGVIGDAVVSLKFTATGTYYLQCKHTGTTDTGLLGFTKASQWFQHKIEVVGVVDRLALTDGTVNIVNQANLSTAVALNLDLNKTYSFKLASTGSVTPSGNKTKVTCTPYSNPDLAAANVVNQLLTVGSSTNQNSFSLETGTNKSTAVTGTAASPADLEAAATTVVVAFDTAGTYYLKCEHVASATADANMLAYMPLGQWFQAKVVVTGAFDKLALTDGTITLSNQVMLASATAVTVDADKPYTFKLASTGTVTPSGNKTKVTCTSYLDTALTTTVDRISNRTSFSLETGTNKSTQITGTLASPVDIETTPTTVVVEFMEPGTFYLKCVHVSSTSTDANMVGYSPLGQWFQTKVTVLGPVNKLALTDGAVAFTNGGSVSVDLQKPYTLKLATTGSVTPSGNNTKVLCSLFRDAAYKQPIPSDFNVDGNLNRSVFAIESTTNATTSLSGTTSSPVDLESTSPATVTIQFESAGTKYMRCEHVASTKTDVNVEAFMPLGQWFQTTVTVAGAFDKVVLTDGTVTLAHQPNLSAATPLYLELDKAYSLKIAATGSLTPNGQKTKVTCAAYSDVSLSNSVSGLFTTGAPNQNTFSVETGTNKSGGNITGTQSSPVDLETTPTTASVALDTTGTYYLKCTHVTTSGTDDAGVIAYMPLDQWFQTAVVVGRAEDRLALVDSTNSLTLSNQANLTTANAVTVSLNKPYSFTLAATGTVTPSGNDTKLTCTPYSQSDLGSTVSNLFTVGGSSNQNTFTLTTTTNKTAEITGTSTSPVTLEPASQEETVVVAFDTVGTFYLKCVHETHGGTVDANVKAYHPLGNYFQVKVNVEGAVDKLALTDGTVTLSHQASLTSATPVELVINRAYNFKLATTGAVQPSGNNTKVTCTPYSDMSMTSAVASLLTVAGVANISAYNIETASNSTNSLSGTANAPVDLATTAQSLAFEAPGLYYLKCVHVAAAGSADNNVIAYTAIGQWFQTKVNVVAVDPTLSIRESPFSAVAGSTGTNDLRPFSKLSGGAMAAGTLLSSPLTDTTTVMVFVGKSYTAGNLVELRPAGAPSAEVMVDCLSSKPEVLPDIYGIQLPSGSVANVGVPIPNVSGAAYVHDTYVTYQCMAVTSVGSYLSTAVVPFRVYVTPKFRLIGGAAAGLRTASGELAAGKDLTLMSSSATDSCKIISVFEGAALGSDIVQLQSAINPGAQTVKVTCTDTSSSLVYRTYPSGGTAATAYVQTVSANGTQTGLVIDQNATGNSATAALISPGGTDVTTLFKCSVTSLDGDDDSTNNNDFATDDEVYFAIQVKRVTLSATWTDVAATSGGVTSIVEGQSPQLTVTRSDGSTSGTYTCSTVTATAGGAAFGTITAVNFGNPITLTAAATQDVTEDTPLEVQCQPVSTLVTDVVYGDSSIAQDRVAVTLTVRPQKLVAFAKGAAGLVRYSDLATAIAPASNVDISGATDAKFQGFVGEESHNAGTALVQIAMNQDDSTPVTGETIRCTVDKKHFLPKDITAFDGASAADLSIETATAADGTENYADVTVDTKVTFTCKAVSSTTSDGVTTYSDKKIGRIAAGESVSFSIWVGPIAPKFVLNINGTAVTSTGATKSSGDLAATDRVTLVEGQSVQNVLKLALNHNASTTSNVDWTCSTAVGGSVTNVLSASPVTLTGVTASGSNIGFDDATFSAFAVGPAGVSFTLRCVYGYTGTGTVPTNVGGITVPTSVEANFTVAAKFPRVVAGSAAPRHPLPSQITTPTTISTGALGNLAENVVLSAFDAVEEYIGVQLERIDAGLRVDATEEELAVEYLVSAINSCPVVYSGTPSTTSLVKLQAPQNLGTAGAMTCRSSDTDVLADITVLAVAEGKDAFTAVEVPVASGVADPILVTYTCTYDGDVTTGTGEATQVHITGGEATTEKVAFTLVVAPPILVTSNSTAARGLTRTTQAYDTDISNAPTSTPVLLAGSAAPAPGSIFTLALNVALSSSVGQPTVNCVSSHPEILASINGIVMNGTVAIANIPVPAPAADAPDTLVTYTCNSTNGNLPVRSAVKTIQVVAPSIRAVGGKATVNGALTPARSMGGPGLAGDELDNEYIDPMYSPVAGLVDLAPVVVEGQETAAGQVASILLPVASTAPITVVCASSDPSLLSSFEETQTVAGTSLPLTIPKSSPVDEPMMVDFTCSVKEAAGGYDAGISTSFSVHVVPLAIQVFNSSDVLQSRPAFSVNEGVAATGLFKIGLNGVPGVPTIVECSAPNATVFKSTTSSTAFSFNTTFTAAGTAVAVDLPASQNVASDTVVAITCKVVTEVATPAPTAGPVSDTPASTTAPATTAPGTTAPATTAAPTPPPATIELNEVVVVRVTVRAGKLTARGGAAARNAAHMSLSGVALSDSAVPVVSLRKRDLANIVTLSAPFIKDPYIITCSSSSASTSTIRTPGGTGNEYTVTATGSFSVTIPGPLKDGDVTITCQPKDAAEGAKGLVQGELVTFKLRVEAPAIQILTGNPSSTATPAVNVLAAASDFAVLPLGTDVTGTGDLSRTLVVPSGYNPPSTALFVRLKAAISTRAPSLTCTSSHPLVMDSVTTNQLSSTMASSLGNRNSTMTVDLDLPAAAAVTEDTVVTYTCELKCDLTSATLGSASFDVWVPAPQFFVRSSGSTKARASDLVTASSVAPGTKVSEMYMGADSTQTVAVYTSTIPSGDVRVNCESDMPYIRVNSANSATVSATSTTGIFYSVTPAATLTVHSTATANGVAMVVCTPDISVGSYTTSKTFSFSVRVEPQAKMTAVLGTRTAGFDMSKPVALTTKVTVEAIGEGVAGLVALFSSGGSKTVGCLSSDLSILDDIVMNDGVMVGLASATVNSPAGDFEHSVGPIYSYTTLTASSFSNTNREAIFQANDLIIPAPKAIGTVTYTCQEFTGSAASSMGRPALVQTITPATFEVEVVGRITGTAPPAQSTTVSFKLSMTFDEPPSPDVKQEIFQSVAASTKSTLQTTAPGVAVEIYVREDAGRRRLATFSLNLLVDVVVSDPAAAGAVSAGVTGTNEAVLLDAIIDGIVNAPEGSALAAIAAPSVAVTSSATINTPPTPSATSVPTTTAVPGGTPAPATPTDAEDGSAAAHLGEMVVALVIAALVV